MLYTDFRSFHAVASHGGFSSAARALNISQPTLSTQVKELESRYEVDLFSRIGREVSADTCWTRTLPDNDATAPK